MNINIALFAFARLSGSPARIAKKVLCLAGLALFANFQLHAAELLPGEVPLEWDRVNILGSPLPTIQDVVAAVKSPEIKPLVGFRFYGATRNHYAPLWSADGSSFCCLRSDLNLRTCKLLVFPKLDQPQPHEVYSEFFTTEHMAVWTPDGQSTLYFFSNQEQDREENLHRLQFDRQRQTFATSRVSSGTGTKVLPSVKEAKGELEVVYRHEDQLMQSRYLLGNETPLSARSMGEGQEAVWSRDGRFLALIRDEANAHSLQARDPITLREIPLLAEPGRLIRNASWSPDGRLVACFSRPRDQLQWELWVCPVMKGSSARKIASAVRVDEDFRQVGPVWSADGARLWYLPAEGDQGYYPLSWVSRDGSRTGTLDYNHGLTTALDVAVNPNTQRPALAFVAVEKLAVDVFVLLLNHP